MNTPNIQSIRFLKQNAADLPLDEPMIITQHGKPKYVIESYEEKVRRDEALALLKFIALGEKTIEEEPQTIEDVETYLAGI